MKTVMLWALGTLGVLLRPVYVEPRVIVSPFRLATPPTSLAEKPAPADKLAPITRSQSRP